MNIAADYFAANIPEPWQILGLRLRPFSLGHYKILRRFNCAFVSELESSPTRGDLLLAVLVCSMTPKEFLAWMDSPSFNQDVTDWGKQCGLFSLNEKAQLLNDYISAHSVVPPYWEEKETGASGAHWSQCLEVALRSKLGWAGDEIDSEPLSKAFADYFKHAESEGAIRLMTPEEFALVSGGQDVT